jgi:hypothetical protein
MFTAIWDQHGPFYTTNAGQGNALAVALSIFDANERTTTLWVCDDNKVLWTLHRESNDSITMTKGCRLY